MEWNKTINRMFKITSRPIFALFYTGYMVKKYDFCEPDVVTVGSSLLYRQEVSVCTKSITRIKQKEEFH